MQNQEIRQALELFDSYEKWQAFTTLADKKDEMKSLMYQSAAKRINAFFSSNTVLSNPAWTFFQKNHNSLEIEFYLRDYGDNSVRLTFGWMGQLCLRTSNKHDFNRAALLLTTPEFEVLERCFDRIDVRQDRVYPEFLLTEKFNFSFGTASDGHFGPFRLAWHAHYETDSFLAQLASKIARFQTSEATKALIALNEAVKK